MIKIAFLFYLLIGLKAISQEDTTVVDITGDMDKITKKVTEEEPAMKVFYSQKLINAKTVEVLRKGVLDFSVTHNFGDIAGNGGGISKFFGLDDAADIKIAFQIGLSDKVNILLARTRGASFYKQIFELGLKWQLMRQALNDPKHPFSLTLFTNIIASATKKNPNATPIEEHSFKDFSDRLGELVQLMIARKFGNVSLQVSPTFVTRGFAIPGDEKNLFALGGAARIPLSKKFIFITDYFHTFRPEDSKKFLQGQNINFYDAFGAGFEILTEGHIFHLNFTNATEILENRFIPRTRSSWGKGQYRWGFTITRNFILFRDKK